MLGAALHAAPSIGVQAVDRGVNSASESPDIFGLFP